MSSYKLEMWSEGEIKTHVTTSSIRIPDNKLVFMKNICKTCSLLTYCYLCSLCANMCCTDCLFSVKPTWKQCLFKMDDELSLCLDCVVKQGNTLSEKDQLRASKLYQVDSKKYKESEEEFKSL